MDAILPQKSSASLIRLLKALLLRRGALLRLGSDRKHEFIQSLDGEPSHFGSIASHRGEDVLDIVRFLIVRHLLAQFPE
jgi:hypothetical protein